VKKFLGNMGLSTAQNWSFLTACVDVAEAAKPQQRVDGSRAARPWDSKQGPTIAGAVLFMMSQLPRSPRALTLEELASVTGQADTTIAGAYVDLHPFARELIPASWASDEAVKGLSTPVVKK